MPTLTHYLTLSAVMFSIGLFGALTRRNAISILMCIEIMLNAVNINLAAFSRYLSDPLTGRYLSAWFGDVAAPWQGGPLGQVFVVFTITVAAAEASVALAIVLAIYRSRKTIQIDDINLMKW